MWSLSKYPAPDQVEDLDCVFHCWCQYCVTNHIWELPTNSVGPSHGRIWTFEICRSLRLLVCWLLVSPGLGTSSMVVQENTTFWLCASSGFRSAYKTSRQNANIKTLPHGPGMTFLARRRIPSLFMCWGSTDMQKYLCLGLFVEYED